MRGKAGIRSNIKCPRCGSYDVIPFINVGREDNMCQKCGFIIENVKR